MNINISPFVKRFLNVQMDTARGIPSMRNWRFWASLLAITVATCVLARDPMFYSLEHGFKYASGVLCILLSYLVLSALFWELLLFGRPQGANLFLHWVAPIPFTLFIARTFINSSSDRDSTLLQAVWSCITTVEGEIGLSKAIRNLLPDWLTDIFAHPSVAMVLLFVVLSLCFKKKGCRIGLLFVALLIGIASALSALVNWQFIIGTLTLVVAFVLMYNPYDEQCFYSNWIGELSRKPVGEVELDVISKVMTEAYSRGRLSYGEVGELIRPYLPDVSNGKEELQVIVREFVDRVLLRYYNFVSLTGDASGVYLTVNPRLMSYGSMISALAIYPRRLIVAMIGLVWLVSPLDVIPDAIPFVGVLDDVAVALLSMKSIMVKRNDDMKSVSMPAY